MFRSPLDGGFDIIDTADRVDPFFSEGPFLTFLRLAPHEALACLIEVMNVCVERWVKNVPPEEASRNDESPRRRLVADLFGNRRNAFLAPRRQSSAFDT